MRAPDEHFATVGDVELCYETFGDPASPPMLLIMGLGTQMIAWHDELCGQLARRGYFVVRYDNRDVGRSSRIDGVRPPTPSEIVRRRPGRVAYTLSDMARDGAGLLDHLGLESAHVVGASMGGMIAQTLAVEAPERVRSLTSIMSNTGSRWTGQPAVGLYPVLLRRPPAGRDAYAEFTVQLMRRIGSPGFERDEDDLREMARLAFDRGLSAAGTGRQLAAIMASGDRSAALRRIAAPTLVIHGSADRLVRPSGGRATARAIPGARLMLVEGMGHDLPRGAWPRLVDAIAEHAAAADSGDAAPPRRSPAAAES
jgi:pimeloyl-ACP methyl ester carboxylesterase